MSSSTQLLPFQRTILENIHDPATSDLLLLARGLGLRRLVCTLLKIYDGPSNLVLLVNATTEEEAAIGEELGIMGCRKPGLRVVDYEMGRKERYVGSRALCAFVYDDERKAEFVQAGRSDLGDDAHPHRRHAAEGHACRARHRLDGSAR